MTVLLEIVGSYQLKDVDLAPYRDMLRKRLDRAGLGNAIVIGGFELAYKEKQKSWIFHINLVVIGGGESAIEHFQSSFDESDLYRPTMTVQLKDLPEQLSYTVKFCTYHRPFQQYGPAKSAAVPLNQKEHLALVGGCTSASSQTFYFCLMRDTRGRGLNHAPSPRANRQQPLDEAPP